MAGLDTTYDDVNIFFFLQDLKATSFSIFANVQHAVHPTGTEHGFQSTQVVYSDRPLWIKVQDAMRS